MVRTQQPSMGCLCQSLKEPLKVATAIKGSHSGTPAFSNSTVDEIQIMSPKDFTATENRRTIYAVSLTN